MNRKNKKRTHELKKYNNYDDVLIVRFAHYLYVGAVLAFCFLIGHVLLRYLLDDRVINNISFAIAMVVCFAFLLFALFVLSDRNQLKIMQQHHEEQMQNLITYTEHVDEMTLDLRHFRHDHANMLIGLNGFVQKRDWDGLDQYFSNYQREFVKYSEIEDAIVKKLSRIKIPALHSILLAKCLHAYHEGIKVWVEISDNIILSDDALLLDLCRIVGILIDNAYEACVINSELRVMMLMMDDGIHIIIENTCENPPVVELVFKRGYSTKGNHRGLGLYHVSKIISENDAINLITNAQNGFFTQKLMVLQTNDVVS